MSKRNNKHSDTSLSRSPYSILKLMIFFIILFLVIGIILSFVSSCIGYKLADPTKYSSYIGKACLVASLFITTIIVCRKSAYSRLLTGVITGIIALLLIGVVSLALPGKSQINVFWYLSIPLVTILSSLISVKRTAKRHHRKRK